MNLEKYSFGIGDRFAHQGIAQLQALVQAKQDGINFVPVWNKSYREHQIIHSDPKQAQIEAEMAVKTLNWQDSYYVDADHINLTNVDAFIHYCNFFTIDVADYIGTAAAEEDINNFLNFNAKHAVPGLTTTAQKFLYAIQQAEKVYRRILEHKNAADFVVEISMDEVDQPQTPTELFFILSAVAFYKIPAQTIAPKFSGRFNKGVDYVGDLDQFTHEFEQDLLTIDKAINTFDLPRNLKLSIHSGSDKFSIYPIMGQLIKKHNQGIHIKTAGTTWLEELIGLSLADTKALNLVKEIYAKAHMRRAELCEPYATVINIDKRQLPTPSIVNDWDGTKFANTLRHIPDNPDFNPNFRQLLHVAYKIAAEYGSDFTNLLEQHADIIGKQVTENLYDRHLKRLNLN
jgi:hypothetical protein